MTTARLQLDDYLARVRRRLQWVLSAQGAAVLGATLLLVTLIAAWFVRSRAFSDSAAQSGRVALAVAVAAAGIWFALRWRAQRRGAGAATFEAALPAQQGRIATYLQEGARPGGASPLIDLLAADALALADRERLSDTIPGKRIWLPVLAAVASVGLIGALIASSGSFGEGARHLWLGRLPPAASIAAAAGGIAVQPGDATVLRNRDLPISALVAGGEAGAQLHVRFEGASEWETAPMEADGKGGFAFTLFAVREAAQYYVSAGRQKSAEHRISVVDLPTIEQLRLTYDYPGWTGLPRRLEEDGGDIRAVAGTRVTVEAVASGPLPGPLLVIDGKDSNLAQTASTSRGSLSVNKDGNYRIATRFGDEIVPLTPDYAIEVVEDQKPDVRIARPGKDYRATAIEEVPVRVHAQDDFRLESLELQYSVNGGDWRNEQLPAGSSDIEAAALLRLEEMQQRGPGGEAPLLTPGDLVSYYALAKDHKHSVQTDLFLIQVQPFEQRYTQSQAGGGGGGGGGGGEEEEDGNISRRQKEVLLATWNLQRTREGATGREAERVEDNARMLSDVQKTLAEQAATLVGRARARQLTGQDADVNQFVRSLEEAAKAMQPAAQNLADMKLEDAVKYEQQALQLLLKAESTFRDIQVAMRTGGGGGGGGGGGSQAGRDVSEMTALELDLEQNQYETERQMSSQQRSQAEDEVARRLRELARRQEQLAREAANQRLPAEAQRWQQEQLRRELEQLQRQLDQLAQQNSQQSGSQQSGSQQSGSQQSGSQSGSQQSGSRQAGQPQGGQQGNQQQRSAQSSAAEAARQQVAQALEQMRNATDAESAQRASQQLNRARERLEQGRQQADSERFSNLADTAGELAERQRAAERELRAAINSRPQSGSASPSLDRDSGMSFQQMERMAEERRRLQAELEELTRRMDTTRRQASGESPRAAEQLAEARQELQEFNTLGNLGLAARDIERGRGVQAATRDAVITDTLERLRRNLETAADTASQESSRRQQGREADAGDLLAELGQVRRALQEARQEQLARGGQGGTQQSRDRQVAQNEPGAGDPGARSPDAREGQQGQAGGQQGQQGQGGQGQRGNQGGNTPGQQGGAQGGADGGDGNFGEFGIAGNNWGGSDGRFISGGVRADVPRIIPGREVLRVQTRLSAERLEQLRQQLADGPLSEADARAISELAQRLRRGGPDPMEAEYDRITALVNQLELAALKVQQEQEGRNPTRGSESMDDSRRYRDNVAEYYRRLGESAAAR